MKIQLDTEKKTIKIEDDILLAKLVETLNKLLPNGEWKKFTLQTNTTIHQWAAPIVIKEYPTYPRYPWYWSSNYTALCLADNKITAEYKAGQDTNLSLQSGVYNIEA